MHEGRSPDQPSTVCSNAMRLALRSCSNEREERDKQRCSANPFSMTSTCAEQMYTHARTHKHTHTHTSNGKHRAAFEFVSLSLAQTAFSPASDATCDASSVNQASASVIARS